MFLFHMRPAKERPKLKNKLERKKKLNRNTRTCINLTNCHARGERKKLKKDKEICILCDPFAKVLLNSITMCFATKKLIILLPFSPLDFKI